MKPFSAWSFCRDVLSRGTSIEQDTRSQGRGYEAHSARLDANAREFADELKPHRSHLCGTCGLVWRPADVPTNGVAAVKTRGEDDTPRDQWQEASEASDPTHPVK